MNKFFILIIIILAFVPQLFAQNDESKYSVNAIAGAGYGIFFTDLNSKGLNNHGFNGSLRIMWQPEHLLRIGLQSGFIQFYSSSQSNVDTDFGVTDIETKLTAMPILAVYSMLIFDQFEVNIGAGPYILYSTVNSHDNKVTSTQLSSGFMLSGTYFHSINHSISIGGELKWDYVNKINDGSLSLQFILKYILLEY